MDKNYFQIIELMIKNRYVSQREIASDLKISAAYVNKIIAAMEQAQLLRPCDTLAAGKKRLTEKALHAFEECKVDNAIVMAAGFGSRFVPYKLYNA